MVLGMLAHDDLLMSGRRVGGEPREFSIRRESLKSKLPSDIMAFSTDGAMLEIGGLVGDGGIVSGAPWPG